IYAILILFERLRKPPRAMLAENFSRRLCMKTNPNRFWLLVILLGWAFDFLFWEKPLGVNFFIFVTLCIVTGIYLLQTDGLRLSRRGSLLLLPLAFFAALTFFRREPMTVFLAVSMSIFLMGVFALTYLGGNWTR